MMLFKSVVSLLFLFKFGWAGVIIPEELPSLLSVAYSNIPPIKKGTDSRVGFGFAFGNHADFQVMFELGPQTNTNPIGQAFPTNAKRQALYEANKINKNRDKFLQSDAGKYLLNWSQKMKKPTKYAIEEEEEELKQHQPGDVPNLEESMVELVQNSKGEYEIHQPSPTNIRSSALAELKRLYGQEKDQKPAERSKEEIKKITEDLSNVDLD